MNAHIDPRWLRAPPTRRVLQALEAARPGGSRFVGGCVRNALLGLEADDIDIATQLTPERTIAAAQAAGLAAHPTGLEHGTVTLVAEGAPFEVTTLRRDVETDGRRAVVAFTERWEEDAQRRDFRMNALYADADGLVHDPTGGGLADIAARRIIFIGDAETRLREDYLRILRFFRFSAWYARQFDADGLAACARLRSGVLGLSAERVWKELKKLLAAPRAGAALCAMQDVGVLALTLGFDPPSAVWPMLETLGEADPLVRLGALAQGAEAAAGLARRLKLANEERDRLTAMLDPALALTSDFSAPALRRTLYRFGPQAVLDKAALLAARTPSPAWGLICAAAHAYVRPRLPVTGADAQALGLKPGPAVGAALRAVEAWWIAADFPDDRPAALAKLQRAIGGGPPA